VSVDQPVFFAVREQGGRALSILDLQQANGDTEAEASIDRSLCRADVSMFVESALRGRELEVIKLRYGVGCGEEAWQPRQVPEVASYLGIERSSVRNLEIRALTKLKTARKTLLRESTEVDCADCLREHDEAMSVCEGGRRPRGCV